MAGIVLGCYGLAWLVAGRLVFYALRSDNSGRSDSIDTFLLAAMAMITALSWPLVLPIAVIMWHPRKTPAELRQQVESRDRRIAELERELGMDRRP